MDINENLIEEITMQRESAYAEIVHLGKQLAAMTTENERLTNELAIAMRQGGTARTELMLENRDLRAQVAALEQKYKEASDEKQRKIESDQLYKFVAKERDTMEQQFAAMTAERDGLMRRIEEEEPIFHDMMQQLAAMTKDRDDWVAEAEQFSAKHAASEARAKELEDWHLAVYADIKRNDELQAENADLRALAERLLARLSENKVMIDDIKIMGEL